jgi:hypothetical protein
MPGQPQDLFLYSGHYEPALSFDNSFEYPFEHPFEYIVADIFEH